VTVLKQSSVYPTIGGDETGFFLDIGRTLTTVQPCADNWCLLAVPDLPGGPHGDLPAGQGRVYSGIDNGDNFLKKN
jgi:hypothetical protein